MAADALVFDFGSVAFLGLIARKSPSTPTSGVASDGFGYWSVVVSVVVTITWTRFCRTLRPIFRSGGWKTFQTCDSCNAVLNRSASYFVRDVAAFLI